MSDTYEFLSFCKKETKKKTKNACREIFHIKGAQFNFNDRNFNIYRDCGHLCKTEREKERRSIIVFQDSSL